MQHILNMKGSLGCAVSFFFVQSDDNDSLDVNVILRSILRQRLEGMKISRVMEIRLQKMISSLISSDIVELLRESMTTLQESYILIDGLDECDNEDRKELLKTLSALVSSSKNVRLFLASRASLQKEIKKHFTALEHLTLDCKSTNDDIGTYIEGFIHERLQDGELEVGDPALINEIKQALTRGSQGM